MTQARTYISRVDMGGRLVVMRSDGEPISQDEKAWFDKVVTDKIRSAALMESKKKYAVIEYEEGKLHPFIDALRTVIIKNGFGQRMAWLSETIGRRRSAVSEWLRGLSKPYFNDVYALYGLLGYRVVAIPVDCLGAVMEIINEEQATLDTGLHKNSMGDEYPCEGSEMGVCGGEPHNEACPSYTGPKE